MRTRVQHKGTLLDCHLNKQRLINSLEAEVNESAVLIEGTQTALPYNISRYLRGSLSVIDNAVQQRAFGDSYVPQVTSL